MAIRFDSILGRFRKRDNSTQLTGNLDVNGYSIDWGDILTTNGTYKGDIMNVTVHSNSIGFGACLAHGGNGAVYSLSEADADTIDRTAFLCMALQTGTGIKKVLFRGQICNTSWDWDPGYIYLSTTEGTLTQDSKPSGTDDVPIVVGYSLSNTTMFFDPYLYFQILL